MKIPIPDDWNGEDWHCIRVRWPDSTLYNALLVGFLTQMARGRFWDERTGLISDAQAVAQQVIENNLPFVSCTGEQIDTPGVIATRGGGIVIIGDDDMGQVVTDWYVDSATGEFVVKFGHCCEERFSIAQQTIPGETSDTGEPEIPTIIPGEEDPYIPSLEYSACAKATTVVERIEAIARAAWGARTDPYSMKGAIEDANPGYSVGVTWVYSIYVKALGLMAIEGVADADIFNAEFYNAWISWLISRLEDDPAGLSSSEWAAMINWVQYEWVFNYETPDLSTVIDFWLAGFYVNILNMLGRERFNQIMQEGMLRTDVDCTGLGLGTGEVTEYAGDLIWTGTIEDPPQDEPYTVTWLNQGKTLNVRVGPIVATQYAGLEDHTDFYMQVVNGGSVTEFVVVVEMVTGNMTQEWGTDNCDTVGSPYWDGSKGAVETHEDFGGGNIRTTYDTSVTPWTGSEFIVENVRFCPHDDVDGTYVEWNMHIVSVNGVPTGITDPFEGETPLP